MFAHKNNLAHLLNEYCEKQKILWARIFSIFRATNLGAKFDEARMKILLSSDVYSHYTQNVAFLNFCFYLLIFRTYTCGNWKDQTFFVPYLYVYFSTLQKQHGFWTITMWICRVFEKCCLRMRPIYISPAIGFMNS